MPVASSAVSPAVERLNPSAEFNVLLSVLGVSVSSEAGFAASVIVLSSFFLLESELVEESVFFSSVLSVFSESDFVELCKEELPVL